MININIMKEFLINDSGKKYSKPINEEDKMNDVRKRGQRARESFKELGTRVINKISSYDMVVCTNWVGQNQIIPNYLWIQYKKVGYEKCPSSISLSFKIVDELIYMYVAVEIKDIVATEVDFKKHNKILDLTLNNEELYYSGDNKENFNLGRDSYLVKQLISSKNINKVRIQKNVDFDKSEEEIIDSIVDNINLLEPYYNEIINEYESVDENKEENINTTWIIPCNIKQYDIFGAFNELKVIEWKQSTNVKKGDYIYIYVGNPYKEIKYKCIVREANIKNPRIDDLKFCLEDSNYRDSKRYMEIELLEKFDDKLFVLSELKENGLVSAQGPIRLKDRLLDYIRNKESIIRNTLKESNSSEDMDLLKEINDSDFRVELESNYKGVKKVKVEPKVYNGVKVYPREKKISMNALAIAGYKCEVDNSHYTFIRKNIDVGYTEPHHLVPMAFSSLFEVSLDVEENIVSLCSSCHNNLHYGRDVEEILIKLYQQRQEYLYKVGINVTIEELIRMYKKQ